MKKCVLFFVAVIFSLLPTFSQNTSSNQGHLIVLLGQDTVGVEQFQINGNEILIETIRRVNKIIRQKARITYREDGTIQRMETLEFNASDSLIMEHIVKSEGDKLYHENNRNGKSNTWVQSGRPHLPAAQIPFFATYEKFIQIYEKSPEATFRFEAGNEQLIVKKTGENDYELTTEVFRTLRIKSNQDKEFLALNSRGTGLMSYEARRVDMQVYEAIAERWWNNPSTKTISTVSPRIKESFNIHGTEIKVNYSQTSKRGRLIFGGLVPFGKVWRTGSNMATHINFKSDVVFGGKTIEKGRYTLYTIPQKDEWLFLLNKQTGQWGAFYDESQEALRLPMKTNNSHVESERLLIEVEEIEKGGEIIIKWDHVKASIPFQISQ